MRTVIVTVLSVVVLWGATPAMAEDEPGDPEQTEPKQSDPPPSDDPAALTEKQKLAKARGHYAAGKKHQQARELDDALAEYQAAFDLTGMPVLVYNMAQVHRLAGRRAEAIAEYERYLSLEPKGRGAANAQELVIALKKQLAEEKAAADAQAADPEKPIEAPPVVTPVPPVSDEPIAPPLGFPRAGRGKRIAGMIVGGLGLVAVGVGISFGLEARDKSVEVEDLDGRWDPDDERIWNRGESAERNMLLFTAIGGAAVVGGALLYVLGWQSGTAERRVVAVPTAGEDFSGVAVSGWF